MPPKRTKAAAMVPASRGRPAPEGPGPWKVAPPIVAEDVDPDWSASSSESSEGSGNERTRRLEQRRQQRRKRGDAQKAATEAAKSTTFAIANKQQANEEWLYASGQKERPPLPPMDYVPHLTLDVLRGNRRSLAPRVEEVKEERKCVPTGESKKNSPSNSTDAPHPSQLPTAVSEDEQRPAPAPIAPNLPLNARIQKVYEAMFDEWVARGDDAVFVADDALREAERRVMSSDVDSAPIYSSMTVLSAHRHQREHFAATVKRKETLEAAEEILNRFVRSSHFTRHVQRLLESHHRPFVDTLSSTAKGEFSHDHHNVFRQYSVDMYGLLSAHLRRHGVAADDAFFDELFEADMDTSLLSVDAWEVILSIVKFEVFVDVVEDFVKEHYKLQSGLDVERRLSRKVTGGSERASESESDAKRTPRSNSQAHAAPQVVGSLTPSEIGAPRTISVVSVPQSLDARSTPVLTLPAQKGELPAKSHTSSMATKSLSMKPPVQGHVGKSGANATANRSQRKR